MPAQLRAFEKADPFGRTWSVEFRWLQNAISIRHADAVDLKYYLTSEEERREMVLALPNAALAAVAARTGRPVTDAWCLRLGSLHLERMISTWEDMDKTVVTISVGDIQELATAIQEADREVREQAALHH